MNKTVVRCRCGHQVLAREVLRTDLYERALGREYVYVKFRCRRCKRMGEAFVSEARWDWSILEPAPGEMTGEERDRFLDADEISDADISAFHAQLEQLSRIEDLARAENSNEEKPAGKKPKTETPEEFTEKSHPNEPPAGD